MDLDANDVFACNEEGGIHHEFVEGRLSAVGVGLGVVIDDGVCVEAITNNR